MFLSSACALNEKKEWINELNVFPVPDGDTGTNMTMTIMSAAREVQESTDNSMETLCKAISTGSLRGARGNSGVILSQLLRGFTKSVRELEIITVPDAAEAFQRATESAFKAVMMPKEGTILTVAKEMAQKADELKESEDGVAFFSEVVRTGDEALAHTPELLPVLKQAGVVDSGGQGLMVIMHECLDVLLGKKVDINRLPLVTPGAHMSSGEVRVDTSNLETSDIKFGYCTEFIIDAPRFGDADEADFRQYLESLGDSLVLVADDGVVKVHVHTNDPGLAIQRALNYGSLSSIKIDNMRLEHEERLFKNVEYVDGKAQGLPESGTVKPDHEEPRKDVGFVAVCAGEGLAGIFKDMGADCVISGGQTMNPSTDDILSAVKSVNADTVFVLPNNKNIILAATQAAQMTEDKNVLVVPEKSIPEGIFCLMTYVPEMTPEDNLEVMKEELGAVKTIEVTYAIRDTVLNGVEVHKDDYMAISDGGIAAAGPDISEVVKQAVAAAVNEDSSVVTIYQGEDVSREDAEALTREIEAICGEAEVELHYGGQPVYYYIVSVE
ncbi:MAG: DAK2 domain-containing protein [Lachnospiraceae bacterium]|nr:DAK2 domain-containing protein [Lachnospiraceae bacterium]